MNIFGYDQCTEDLHHEIGNKAANVSTLHRKGYRVPAGFAIAASFLREGAGSSPDTAGLAASFKILRPPLVVRSSAVGEDSRGRSCAGIFESVLNVVTQNQYIAAIQKVYHSGSGDVWKSYARDERPRMAILVQECVPADHSGVTFTANPVNNDHTEIMVEYFSGLGVSVVGGKTTPHHLIIDRNSRRVKEFIKSGGGTACFPDKDGGYRESSLARGELTYVPEEMMRDIVKKAIGLEMLFGCPQDMEWAVAEGKLYILQSRPITGLSGGRR